RNTASGVPNSRNSRAVSRAAMPGVKVSASHEREASGSMLLKAYGYDDRLVKFSLKNQDPFTFAFAVGAL
ncbi:MAG: hypothetical protein WBQ59_09565, partial [Candidatus Acidiferrum sp.]